MLYSILMGLLVNVLAPLMPSVEVAQEPVGGTWLFCLAPLMANVYLWVVCSADMAVLIICVDILSISLCHTCLL